ncbi:MAG: cbb3-type cytochrome c oxidase subunit I [Acidobacteriota bacterium]
MQGAAAVFFLGVGFALILLARWQLGWPSQAPPVVGTLLEAVLGERAPQGVVMPELYLQLVAMHGTIMVFLGVVPLAVGGFGGLLVPPMLGARAMALPRLHTASVALFLAAGGVMLGSFALPQGAARSGWTSYPPLADLEPAGQTWWLVGMLALGLSAIAGAIVWIVTIVQRRAPGMTFARLPFFVWTQLVAAFLLLLAFPPFLVAAVFQLLDRIGGTAFFLPHGLAAGEAGAVAAALDGLERGGGSPVLWQHLFWFLAHPEVYVLVLPALGIVAEVLTSGARRPLWGRRAAVASVVAVGGLSFLVWAHHMFLTGMGAALSTFFQATTLIISIPTVVVVTSLVLTLWGGALHWRPSTLFAVGFLPLFGLGGLSGLPLGLAASDVHLHDTWYVVGHFHLVVAPGTLFALFAGLYHWWPWLTGRRLDEPLGRLHFWLSTPTMLLTFGPMLVQGLAGLHRRLWDGGAAYAGVADASALHRPVSWAAFLLALAQLPLLVALMRDLRAARGGGASARANPWRATTLEWLEPGDRPPRVVRGPDQYGSMPDTPEGDAAEDFAPQGTPQAEGPSWEQIEAAQDTDHPTTGWSTPGLATALALAASAMAFGALAASAVLLRAADATWPALEGLGLSPWLLWSATALLLVAGLASTTRRPALGALLGFCAMIAWVAVVTAPLMTIASSIPNRLALVQILAGFLVVHAALGSWAALRRPALAPPTLLLAALYAVFGFVFPGVV